jgi:hypothetical protein
MPIYFGIPVTCQEAFRLFDLDFQEVKCAIMQKNKLAEHMYMDCHFVDYMNAFFKRQTLDMRLFYTDKGQCIVGYKIKEAGIFEAKFVKVSDFITLLAGLTSSFARETNDYKENFREVTLEHMEDEPETVSFPEPYIIEYNN